MRRLASIAICAAALMIAAPASAEIFVFGSLLGPEVTGATGTGFVEVIFDTDADTLALSTTWSGLSGLTTVAHIHCCVASPGTIGVAVTPGTLPGFPVGVSSGSYSTLLDLSDANIYTASFLTNFGGGTAEGAEIALLAGLQSESAYFNIHTSAFPAGEIRGFLTAVPEPQSWALMIVGFGLTGVALRRRRGLALTAVH
jgi:hypothetical protein